MCSKQPEDHREFTGRNMQGALVDRHSLWVLSFGAFLYPLLLVTCRSIPPRLLLTICGRPQSQAVCSLALLTLLFVAQVWSWSLFLCLRFCWEGFPPELLVPWQRAKSPLLSQGFIAPYLALG